MGATIDYVEPVELSKELVSKYANEINSLRYLAQGLEFLFLQVKETEDKILAQSDKLTVFFVGKPPDLHWINDGFIACAFHWYAVSACNYARLVGWLASDGDSSEAAKYVERVLPAVQIWRNKVGAHFAKTSPKPDDTPADLEMSVMYPIGFLVDSFWTNPLTLTMRRGGTVSSSRQDMRWSLTRMHGDLSARYWPRGRQESLDLPLTRLFPP
jgi:hypothetical protein